MKDFNNLLTSQLLLTVNNVINDNSLKKSSSDERDLRFESRTFENFCSPPATVVHYVHKIEIPEFSVKMMHI